MNNRGRRAIRLAMAAGYWTACIGFATGILNRSEFGHTLLLKVLTVLLATCGSFVFGFAVVGGFAYAFTPSTDELTTNTNFPGAGQLVWPLVALLVAATIYLVVAYR